MLQCTEIEPGGERMSPNIRIDRDVYNALQKQAKPFTDTPNSVLRRLLGLEPVASSPVSEGSSVKTKRRKSASAGRSRADRKEVVPRAPAGVLLPEKEYVLPLLSILSERGGSAPARETIEAVGRKLQDRLTPTDREKTASGVVRWQNRVQFVRLKLVEEGLLAKDSSRGVWSLTDVGRARLNGMKSR